MSVTTACSRMLTNPSLTIFQVIKELVEFKPVCLEFILLSFSLYEVSFAQCVTIETIAGIEYPFAKKYICEVEAPGTWDKVTTRPHITEVPVSDWTDSPMVRCPSQHVTHRFMACDVKGRVLVAGYFGVQ